MDCQPEIGPGRGQYVFSRSPCHRDGVERASPLGIPANDEGPAMGWPVEVEFQIKLVLAATWETAPL